MAYHGGQMVMPEQPSAKTVVESVRDLLHSTSSYAQPDVQDKATFVSVQHVRFAVGQPLVTTVFIGYSNGYQVWGLAGDAGTARELVSVRNGKHTYLVRLLATPSCRSASVVDRYADKRPLVAVCCDEQVAGREQSKRNGSRPSNGTCGSLGHSGTRCVEIVSLRTGEQLEKLPIRNCEPNMVVENVLTNERWVVTVQSFATATNGTASVNGSVNGIGSSNVNIGVAQSGCVISVFDAASLRPMVQLRVGAMPGAVALGERWLAFGERRQRTALASYGGVTNGPASGSYVAAALDVTKTLLRSFAALSGSVASWTAGTQPHGGTAAAPNSTGLSGDAASNEGSARFGAVTVVDLVRFTSVVDSYWRETGVQGGLLDAVPAGPNPADALLSLATVAHFVAHADEPVQRVVFDTAGSLLLTSGASGRLFNVFALHTAISTSQRAAVHHLYVLRRGNTECVLQDVAFAADSRFVAVTSQRGTVHLFAIAPYGGAPTMRTHAAPRVVNRSSKFQRSAGLDELPPVGGVVLSSSPHTATLFGASSSTPLGDEVPTPAARIACLLNPRRPPFPLPVELSPAAQLHRTLAPFALNLTDAPPPSAADSCPELIATTFGAPSSDENASPNGIALLSAFRALAASPPTIAAAPCCVDVLVAINGAAGTLTQYDVVVDCVSRDQRAGAANGDAPISVTLTPRIVWPLRRSAGAAALPPSEKLLQLLGVNLVPRLSNPNTSLPIACAPSKRRPVSSHDMVDAGGEWMSQVEIVTYSGPHRRLWMGPQFTFCIKPHEPHAHDVPRDANCTLLPTPALKPSAFQHSYQPLDTLVPLVSTSSSVLQTLSERDANSAARSSPIAIRGAEGRQRPNGNVRMEAYSIGSTGSIPTASLTAGSYEPVDASCEHDESLRTCVGSVDQSRIRQTIEDALLESPTNDDAIRRGTPDTARCAAAVCTRVADSDSVLSPIIDRSSIDAYDLGLESIPNPVACSDAAEPDKTSSSSEAEPALTWSTARTNGRGNGNANGGRAPRRNGKQKRGTSGSAGFGAHANMSP